MKLRLLDEKGKILDEWEVNKLNPKLVEIIMQDIKAEKKCGDKSCADCKEECPLYGT